MYYNVQSMLQRVSNIQQLTDIQKCLLFLIKVTVFTEQSEHSAYYAKCTCIQKLGQNSGVSFPNKNKEKTFTSVYVNKRSFFCVVPQIRPTSMLHILYLKILI